MTRSPDFTSGFGKETEDKQNELDKDSYSDQSMDEGVKASNARQSTLRSPKATNEFKSIGKTNKLNEGIRFDKRYEPTYRSP